MILQSRPRLNLWCRGEALTERQPCYQHGPQDWAGSFYPGTLRTKRIRALIVRLRRLFGLRLGFFNFAALGWVGLPLRVLRRPILIVGLLVADLAPELDRRTVRCPRSRRRSAFGRRLSRLIEIGAQLQGFGLAVQMQIDLVALNGLDLPAGDRVASMQPAGVLALRLQQGRRALLGQERADELDRNGFARALLPRSRSQRTDDVTPRTAGGRRSPRTRAGAAARTRQARVQTRATARPDGPRSPAARAAATAPARRPRRAPCKAETRSLYPSGSIAGPFVSAALLMRVAATSASISSLRVIGSLFRHSAPAVSGAAGRCRGAGAQAGCSRR